MPAQPTVFGDAVTLSRRLPRRFILLFLGLITFAAVSILVFIIPSSIPSTSAVQELTDGIPPPSPAKSKILKVPGLSRIWGEAAHAPPVQANSTGVAGEATWYSDWKWLHPFSSSVTLDENRAVLPPFRTRPTIYTFYDHSAEKTDDLKKAEANLLKIWRRAWWAQGFRPVILGRPEAMHNPLYETLQSRHLDPLLETELIRWLAWEHMGSGILSNWLAFPMGDYEDSLLSHLRRGQYPKLTRYETLGGGIFSGDGPEITAALKEALASPSLNQSNSFIESVPKGTFAVDPAHDSIAFYDTAAIKKYYKPVAQKLGINRAAALEELADLINSHLHLTFQNHFANGIAVLNPPLQHMSAVIAPALDIAASLSACSHSPHPLSCPPNHPTCKPCDPENPLPVLTPAAYRNDSSFFTIGMVPHPYTLDMIQFPSRATMDARFIRRETDRNPWLNNITNTILPPPASDSMRILAFKEAVAGESSASHSLWMTAEKEPPTDLDWRFGFALPPATAKKPPPPPPSTAEQTAADLTAIGTPDTPPAPPDPAHELTPAELQQEQARLAMARETVRAKTGPRATLRKVAEAWSMADTEAWRFARAYLARSKVERLKWEEEEERFTVAEGGRKGWKGWWR